MDITKLLEFAVQQDASDLHISSGEPPMMRVDGSMKKLKTAELTPDETRAMLYDIMNDERIFRLCTRKFLSNRLHELGNKNLGNFWVCQNTFHCFCPLRICGIQAGAQGFQLRISEI